MVDSAVQPEGSDQEKNAIDHQPKSSTPCEESVNHVFVSSPLEGTTLEMTCSEEEQVCK